ncbi:hypothetical protein GCM10023331_31070 [Algivirga pacifica]|uniref:DUF4369 domain-containing protein n=2 Tax=Algivirga pacifica TaxID=1162670 RepID=A0ABP9DGI4_9BACT
MNLILLFTLLCVFFNCNDRQQEKKVDKENTEQGTSGFPQQEKIKILNLPNGKKIYVSAKIWGISSNHEEIVFSETPITVPDKNKDFIFYTNEVFYKVSGKRLYIYACDCDTSEPKATFKGVNVILNNLKTSSQIKDYSINYKKYGLEKMSIHHSPPSSHSLPE